MHESTGVMAKYLAEKIAEKGIKADLCDLGLSDKDLRQTAGEALYLSVDAAAVVLAAPTVLTGPHPSMMFFAALMNGMRVKARFLGLIGSFGWGTQIEKSLKSLTERLKGEHLPPVLCK
jgi:flavorubredoxin